MRATNLYFPTLKETPAEAELKSHQLMLRAGLIRKLASGLYTWLPLGLRVLKKVEQIVREEMHAIHAQEVLMPAIQPAELWQESKRWEQFGPQLLKMQDRHQRDFCFGPTHEEVITDLIRDEVKSYKQLPFCLYQIQTKFRDEIRPRFGLMRAREFTMKDAYSFHLNEACLATTYQAMFQAYNNIFTRLGLKFRAVIADSGNIGGKVSQEFHVLADSGEDELAYCEQSDYAANVEKASALPITEEKVAATQEKHLVSTPGITSVEAQAEYMKLPTAKILKTIIVQGATEDHPQVALLLRGDHQLNPIKAEKLELVATPLTLVDEATLQQVAKCPAGFIGPINLNIPLIADRDTQSMVDFSCGANQKDQHFNGVNWQADIPKIDMVADIRQVQPGDQCEDGKGPLKFARGIEVGHIFQLGTKYSEEMNARVLDEQGKPQPVFMGCYGIGVSRIVAAAIEQNHDDNGIIWPEAMAPFQIAIAPIGANRSEKVKQAAEALYQDLQTKGFEVLLDDRNQRPGVMFKELELIGIPHRVVISEKSLAEGKVEYRSRTASESEMISIETFITRMGKL